MSTSAAQTPRQASIYKLVKRVRWASGNGRRIRVQVEIPGKGWMNLWTRRGR